jgi:hypothetical protein
MHPALLPTTALQADVGHATLTLQIKQALVDSAVAEAEAARVAFSEAAPQRVAEALAKAGLMLQASGQYAQALKPYRWVLYSSKPVRVFLDGNREASRLHRRYASRQEGQTRQEGMFLLYVQYIQSMPGCLQV